MSRARDGRALRSALLFLWAEETLLETTHRRVVAGHVGDGHLRLEVILMGDMAEMYDWGDVDDWGCDEWCKGCRRCASDDQWIMQDGKPVDINKMDTKHLTNVLNFIVRGRKQSMVGAKRWANLKAEGKRRGLRRDPKRGNRYCWSHGFDVVAK